MDKSTRSFTVLPFLVSMFVAVFAMPTNVVQVNAFEMGTEHTQPWRSTALADVCRSVARPLVRLRASLTGVWQDPWCRAALAGSAAVLVALVPETSFHTDALCATTTLIAGTGIKEARQAAADVARRMAENATRAAALDTEINALIDAGQSRALTDEENAKLADLRKQKVQATNLRAAILEQQAAVTARLAEAEAANEAERTAPAVDDPDAAAAARAAASAGIRVGQDRAQLDPKRGFSNHTEQLECIIKAGQTGIVDARLKPLAAAGADEQGGHTNPHGAFLLAPAFSPELLAVRPEVDPTAGRVRSIPMTADRVVFNARVDKNHATSVSGGLTVTRTPQTVAASGSRQEFEQVELVAHDLCGVAYATNRILQTSPISFIAMIEAGFGDEFNAKKLDERLNGTGNAEYEGVIGSDATVTVSKETGQAADTILFENVNRMRARCWRYGDSIWLANHDTIPQVTTLYMPIGTGGERVPIYQPGNEDNPQGTLLGRPIFFSEFCRKLGDLGDIVLGTWSEFLEGQLGQRQQSSSLHVRFLNREETFLFVEMNDGKVWWRSALTPKYSQVTLSPFVILQAR